MDRKKNRETAETNPGSDGKNEAVQIEDIARHYEKPIVLREPFVSIVGSVCTQGLTENDLDILIHGPLDDATRKVVEFRLGRALPSELSKRAQFHDESLGGPFTDHAHIYDLVMVPRKDSRTIMRMMHKQDDPLLDYPKEIGRQDGVVQIHTRGASVHFDMRFQVDKDWLIGWTLFAQKKDAISDINTVTEARAIYDGYTTERGNKYLKPCRAPEYMQAIGKSRQPVEWLTVDGEVIGEGDVGATSQEKGVIVRVANIGVEWGVQEPYFHEYFFFGDRVWQGKFYFRQLLINDKLIWVMHQSKEVLPSILTKRSVDHERMPPPGVSAMPESLMEVTPKDFRFWETKDQDVARKQRDELVASGFFTEKNVRVVDGEIRRVVQKFFLFKKSFDCVARKKKGESKFTLSWLYWRGPMHVRTGPSRQVWLLLLEHGKDVLSWELQLDPRAEDEPITGVFRRYGGHALLSADQELAPGEAIDGAILNDTKDTPAYLRIQDTGTAEIIEEDEGRIVLDLNGKQLRRKVSLIAEEKDSPIWVLENITEKAPIDIDRTDLKPGDHFQPMKPRGGAGIAEFSNIDHIIETWALPDVIKAGIYVEPKWNGFRTIASQDINGKVSIWFEDAKEERSHILPSLAAELAKMSGPFILDGELLDYDDKGNAVSRASLARFSGTDEPQDDSRVRFHVFRVLYWKNNRTKEDEIDAHICLGIFFKQQKYNHVGITPRRETDTIAELRDAIVWASKIDGSEGAMLKRSDATYSLGGGTSSWIKYKTTRRIYAMVYDKEKVKGSKESWNYVCAIGPISESEKFIESDVVTYNEQKWLVIGKTANTNIQADAGDILQVAIYELNLDEKNGKRLIHWFGPPIVEAIRSDLNMPMTIDEVKSLAYPVEVSKQLENKIGSQIPIIKTKEEQYVLGIVLEPNDGQEGAPLDPDSQSDIYSRSEIRQAAHRFMAEFQNIGLMHRSIVNKKVRILESFISPIDFWVAQDGTATTTKQSNYQHVRAGTWLLGLRIEDEDLWQKVKNDELTGLSIGGSARRVEEKS